MGTNYPKSNRWYDDHIYEYSSFFKNAIKRKIYFKIKIPF